MQPINAVPNRLRSKMNNAFFDLSAKGVLIYQDPMIGPLANEEKQVAVVANLKKGCLELKVRGQVEQRFDLGPNTGKACRAAFVAYFTTFESLVAAGGQAAKAA